MKGLTLSRRYYETYGKDMIRNSFPTYESVMAVGLVGEGSECLGYDDAFSEDHDYGPGFCIWLRQSDYDHIGAPLQQAYDALPISFAGYDGRKQSPQADQRVGIFSIEGFYSKYTNTAHYPVDALQWFKIPMHYLRTATNGEIFSDPLGVFTDIRTNLLRFYPKDVIRKKLAANLLVMGQAGQYNYGRSLQREDAGAAYLSAAEFVKATLAAIYLLNRVYMPFYKWAFRGTKALLHCQDSIRLLHRFCALPDTPDNGRQKNDLLEHICASVVAETQRQGYAQESHSFLPHQAEAVTHGIEDVRLRTLPLSLDFD